MKNAGVFAHGMRRTNRAKLIEISGGADRLLAGSYIKGGGGADNQGCHFNSV